MSLGTRLSLLVLCELLTALFCVGTAVVTLHRISEESRYVHAYVFAPVAALGDAIESGVAATAEVISDAPDAPQRAQRAVERVRRFSERYRMEWLVVESADPDAQRFRSLLRSRSRMDLLAREREAVDALDAALRKIDRPRREDIVEMRAALARLNEVNVRFMEVAYDTQEEKQANLMNWFLVVGSAGVVLAPLLGLAVRSAVVPRVKRLVAKIERFREFGLHEPLTDHGGDELAVLAHTLDMGFAAIAARDAERKRFLSVAAHELKTPLTTIKGFAQVALDHRRDPAIGDRALEVISRQSTRLAQLSHDLLLIASADAGELAFKPAPLDLAQVAQRAIGEVSLVAKSRTFPLVTNGDAHLLGDPALLEHALFSLLVQAASMAAAGAPVPVTITTGAGRVRLTVEAHDGAALPDDLHRLTEPFAVLQFEGMGEVRSTGLGLTLVREIAKVHGAALRIEPRCGGGVVFALELRC